MGLHIKPNCSTSYLFGLSLQTSRELLALSCFNFSSFLLISGILLRSCVDPTILYVFE